MLAIYIDEGWTFEGEPSSPPISIEEYFYHSPEFIVFCILILSGILFYVLSFLSSRAGKNFQKANKMPALGNMSFALALFLFILLVVGYEWDNLSHNWTTSFGGSLLFMWQYFCVPLSVAGMTFYAYYFYLDAIKKNTNKAKKILSCGTTIIIFTNLFFLILLISQINIR